MFSTFLEKFYEQNAHDSVYLLHQLDTTIRRLKTSVLNVRIPVDDNALGGTFHLITVANALPIVSSTVVAKAETNRLKFCK